jgi:hypothetical protein
MSAWKDISTAPRDGTWFVTCHAGEPDSYEAGCFRQLMRDEYEDAGGGLYRKKSIPIYDWYGFNNIHRATHWLPLPEPPEHEP